MHCFMFSKNILVWLIMNIRTNKHRNDVIREDAILVCRHFNETSHTFEDHSRITIIETLQDQG